MATLTTHDVAAGLRAGGILDGCRVLVHSSLSSFGRVEGGADAVIDALLTAVGAEGTVVVPTLTGSEELSASNPPIFDPLTTPCWTGRIPETFRQRHEAIRSLHPTHSAAAIGADAQWLTQDHWLSATPCDEYSPYGKLATLPNGLILLIGVDHESNTTMHHVEEMVGVDYHMQRGVAQAQIIVDGQPIYRHYMLHQYGTDRDFNRLEPLYLQRDIQHNFTIGQATLRLIKAAEMVKFTTRCLIADPTILRPAH